MATKRPCVVEGNTPGKTTSKRPSKITSKKTSRRALFDSNAENQDQKKQNVHVREWSLKEKQVLVQYICLYWDGAWADKWPMMKNEGFWNSCAQTVNNICRSNRTGASCRTRVIKHLAKEFNTLSEAEDCLKIDYVFGGDKLNVRAEGQQDKSPLTSPAIDEVLSPVFKSSPRVSADDEFPLHVGDIIRKFVACFKGTMSYRLKNQMLNYLFKLVVMDCGGIDLFNFVNPDFLQTSLNAMNVLHNENKHNLILNLCQCFQVDESKPSTRMPMDRMPFGLIDYNIRFFASSQTRKIICEEHYACWLETMFAHFGHKWLCLHRGPAWQYEEIKSTETIEGRSLLEIAMDESGIDTETPCVSQQSMTSSMCLYGNLVDVESSLECMTLVDPQSHVEADNLEVELPPTQIQGDLSFDNDQSEIHEEAEHIYALEIPRVSNLWSGITNDEMCEIEMGLNRPKEMENFHRIQPTASKTVTRNSGLFDPLKSKVNVASLGPRSIQKRVVSSSFSKTVAIQMKAIKQAHDSNRSGRWWVKADACDLQRGLRESVRGCWEGDVDLGDGSLQSLFGEYQSRCKVVKNIDLNAKTDDIKVNVLKVKMEIENDLEFLTKGNEEASKEYNTAVQGKHAESKMMELAWGVAGFQELLKNAKDFIIQLDVVLKDFHLGGLQSVVKMRSSLLEYLKDLFSKKRLPASYLLVFMIADELRNKKPYAIPIQFIPYKSMTDAMMRNLETKVEDAMKSAGMTVVGFTTDGEFNSLRSQGKSRPISVVELIKNARHEARTTSKNLLISYFKLDDEGRSVKFHSAIPIEDLQWLNDLVNDASHAVEFQHAIRLLRRKLFPFMHDPYHWVEGREETTEEVLKSILAIYLYRKKISDLKQDETDPADFENYLYQPEKDTSTGEAVHHREDHNHLLKRVVACLRDGRIPGIDLRFLRDALHDPTTGLTYEALSGKNKQSVPDCERIIGPGVISFLERQGHASGARVIRLIHNWHKAVDGRGISEEVRSRYCRDMKEWLLEEWMPWFKYMPNYSTLDINRPLKGICGFTREVVVGLVANLESRELRRQEYIARNLPPEHPRASATDDVESLFALLHEMLGNIFDLKQFHEAQPKILSEFNKRINPNLQFYYWTGAKERYTELELPSFNEPSRHDGKERLDKVKISRRGDPGIFVANRASLPQKGQLTARAMFHRAPVALPPQ